MNVSAYIALCGVLLSVLTGTVAYKRGGSAEALRCEQAADKADAADTREALAIHQDQSLKSNEVVTVYVDKIRFLPGPAVVLDRLSGLCDGPAVKAAEAPGGAAMPPDAAHLHGPSGTDTVDRRAQLARELGACYRNKAKLTGLQADVRAKSAPGVQP